MTKQIHLAAHFPGVNNTTVWSDPAATFLATALELWDSWRGDEILADSGTGQFLATAAPGTFRHRDAFFDIAGQFNVPRSPQGRPVIFQAGDSDEGRDFAAAAEIARDVRRAQVSPQTR